MLSSANFSLRGCANLASWHPLSFTQPLKGKYALQSTSNIVIFAHLILPVGGEGTVETSCAASTLCHTTCATSGDLEWNRGVELSIEV